MSTQTDDITDEIIFQNKFGSITASSITVKYKDGVESLKTDSITSVVFKRKRGYILSSLLAIISAICLLSFLGVANMSGLEVLGLLAILIIATLGAIANYMGHHEVVIVASGRELKPVVITMADIKEGKQFVQKLNSMR